MVIRVSWWVLITAWGSYCPCARWGHSQLLGMKGSAFQQSRVRQREREKTEIENKNDNKRQQKWVMIWMESHRSKLSKCGRDSEWNKRKVHERQTQSHRGVIRVNQKNKSLHISNITLQSISQSLIRLDLPAIVFNKVRATCCLHWM